MQKTKRYIDVAVTGPLKRSFTYHLAPDHNLPQLGQRLLIPFGRTRKIGYFLGETTKPIEFQTRQIHSVLDSTSYFTQELFELCLWVSDYYFANPADSLSASLPSILKAHKGATLTWAREIENHALLVGLESLVKPEKRLSQKVQNEIEHHGKGLLRKLIAEKLIFESFHQNIDKRKKKNGYAVENKDAWELFFQKRTPVLEPFENNRSKPQLLEDGWTDYTIRKALEKNILKKIELDLDDSILEFIKPVDNIASLQLTPKQQEITDKISGNLTDGFKPYLLHGITGSGKTLIYCHLAKKIIEQGKSILLLTPEISLSGITLGYFRGIFSNQVTIFHSSMTERERHESWNGLKEGRYKIVIGPRSAVFAPMKDIGLIIVDEEHDSSYKQDDPAPRFQGRDTAIMRAKINKIPVLLGSASPSIESYYNAQQGRYELLTLNERPAGAMLPKVEIVDLKSDRLGGEARFLSYKLKKKIENRLESNEQLILFLNRRGFSPQLKCIECGHVPSCPHCQVTLTYHKVGKKTVCHYCGYLSIEELSCSECTANEFDFIGTGTQRIEEQLPTIFEFAKPVRFDSDSASGRKNGQRILHEFSEGKHNMLLGTQMVTKGLDLAGVSLVGVLSADHGLDLPDFRASEKTFARLLQVAGRSGRKSNTGEVVIQTYYPESYVIRNAASQEYKSFYELEIQSRKMLRFPPFCRLISFVLSGNTEFGVEKASLQFKSSIQNKLKSAGIGSDLLGPAPCPLYYLRKKYRRRIIVKTGSVIQIVKLLSAWENQEQRFGLPTTIKLVVDVDPDDMM